MYNRCVPLLLTAQNEIQYQTTVRLYSVKLKVEVAGKRGNKDGVFTLSTESLMGQSGLLRVTKWKNNHLKLLISLYCENNLSCFVVPLKGLLGVAMTT